MKLFHYTQAGLFPGTKIKKRTLYAEKETLECRLHLK